MGKFHSSIPFLDVILILSFSSWLRSVVGMVQQTKPPAPLLISRRKWVVSAAPKLMGFGVVSARPHAALAVKERNEALCGTGFFTNIWEYRCTELGDIADEGIGKSFSASELGTADSLLSKLNLDSSTSVNEKQQEATPNITIDEKPQKPSLLGSVK